MPQANVELMSLIIDNTHKRNLYDIFFVLQGMKYFNIVVGLEI